jgi:ElaB/YqjD/DUF883 family membrane-anchored ribosome-binding protein
MNSELNTDQMLQDLKAVARDAEDLVKATAGEVSERVREARARLADALESAKQSCARLGPKAIEGAKATDRAIREHPYESMGVAFAVGVLLGVIVSRK